jgi:hypothetical protein
MPLSAWDAIKQLAAQRKADGEKNISAARLIGEIVAEEIARRVS